MLRDRYGRRMEYLRISVTDRCNYRCRYCMPPEGVEFFAHQDILRYEELVRIARVAHGLGLRRVRITGGEPLVRRDLVKFIAALRRELPGLEDLALTTNGALLAPLARDLKTAGLDRVNISLDTLDPTKFRRLTRLGNLDDVLRGVEAAVREGLTPVKLNAVLMRGINDDLEAVTALLRFAREHGATLRFIELMPIGAAETGSQQDYFVPASELIARLQAAGLIREREPFSGQGGGPAVYYRLPEGGRLGFITALSDGFCDACTRLRLSAEGRLYPCLAAPDFIDLRGPLRRGATDDEIATLLRRAVQVKPASHHFTDPAAERRAAAVHKRMSRMGG